MKLRGGAALFVCGVVEFAPPKMFEAGALPLAASPKRLLVGVGAAALLAVVLLLLLLLPNILLLLLGCCVVVLVEPKIPPFAGAVEAAAAVLPKKPPPPTVEAGCSLGVVGLGTAACANLNPLPTPPARLPPPNTLDAGAAVEDAPPPNKLVPADEEGAAALVPPKSEGPVAGAGFRFPKREVGFAVVGVDVCGAPKSEGLGVWFWAVLPPNRDGFWV